MSFRLSFGLLLWLTIFETAPADVVPVRDAASLAAALEISEGFWNDTSPTCFAFRGAESA